MEMSAPTATITATLPIVRAEGESQIPGIDVEQAWGTSASVQSQSQCQAVTLRRQLAKPHPHPHPHTHTHTHGSDMDMDGKDSEREGRKLKGAEHKVEVGVERDVADERVFVP